MSQLGTIGEAVAERWIEKTIQSYPAGAQQSLRGADPFRNPAGHTIQESLRTLAHELLGEMDERAVAPALDALIRLRAVQDCAPSEALSLFFDLRSIVTEVSGSVSQLLERRIDKLTLMAFDRYMACREQIAGLREKELRARLQYAAH